MLNTKEVFNGKFKYAVVFYFSKQDINCAGDLLTYVSPAIDVSTYD